jgi:hypothetical protein
VTPSTIRRPKPKNAFQQLIAAVVANDERRIEDSAVQAVRDRLKSKRPTPAKLVKRTAA